MTNKELLDFAALVVAAAKEVRRLQQGYNNTEGWTLLDVWEAERRLDHLLACDGTRELMERSKSND